MVDRTKNPQPAARPKKQPVEPAENLTAILSQKVVGQPAATRVIVPYIQMFQAGLAQGGHGLLPRGGGVQRVVAPVAGIAATLDQAALLQAVDQRDQPARRRAEPAGDRLLAQPGFAADQAEQSGLRAGEVERRGPLAEPLGRVGAKLRDQERDIRPLAPRLFGLGLFGLGLFRLGLFRLGLLGLGLPGLGLFGLCRCHGTIIHS